MISEMEGTVKTWLDSVCERESQCHDPWNKGCWWCAAV